MPAKPKRREENVEATRAALLKAARKRFARLGYADAAIEDIAADARVTTGAIYHHFAGKKGLFQAVAEQIETELLMAAAAVQGDSDSARVRAGFNQMLEECAAADEQRNVFVEAPQVIGPEKWRAIELRYAYGALQAILSQLIDAKVMRPYPVDLVSRMLLALLRETAGVLPRGGKARAQAHDMVERVFEALRA